MTVAESLLPRPVASEKSRLSDEQKKRRHCEDLLLALALVYDCLFTIDGLFVVVKDRGLVICGSWLVFDGRIV